MCLFLVFLFVLYIYVVKIIKTGGGGGIHLCG